MSENTFTDADLDEIEETSDTLEAVVVGMPPAHALAALSHTLCRLAIAADIDKDLVVAGIAGAYEMIRKRSIN